MKFVVLVFFFIPCFSQNIAVAKYSGGDWYSNPTALTNLIKFCNNNINTALESSYKTVDLSSEEVFSYPYIYLTGHGDVIFSDEEIKNLKKYLLSGGFLHIDDNYGLDRFIRREMKKVFPDKEFIELSVNHSMFSQTFKFINGLPKIHQHDGKRPQGFGIFDESGRLICFYTYECDLGNGWEDREVHNDDEKLRLDALKMGSNIIEYVFSN